MVQLLNHKQKLDTIFVYDRKWIVRCYCYRRLCIIYAVLQAKAIYAVLQAKAIYAVATFFFSGRRYSLYKNDWMLR